MLSHGDFDTTKTINVNLKIMVYVIPNVKILLINTLENAYVKRNGITLYVFWKKILCAKKHSKKYFYLILQFYMVINVNLISALNKIARRSFKKELNAKNNKTNVI